MRLAYVMKVKYPALKRNVKFDEDRMNLYLDMQLDQGQDWRRVLPEQARIATTGRSRDLSGPKELKIDDLNNPLEKGNGSD